MPPPSHPFCGRRFPNCTWPPSAAAAIDDDEWQLLPPSTACAGSFVSLLTSEAYTSAALCLHAQFQRVHTRCPFTLVYDDAAIGESSSKRLALTFGTRLLRLSELVASVGAIDCAQSTRAASGAKGSKRSQRADAGEACTLIRRRAAGKASTFRGARGAETVSGASGARGAETVSGASGARGTVYPGWNRLQTVSLRSVGVKWSNS
jgi:hypothetical protein